MRNLTARMARAAAVLTLITAGVVAGSGSVASAASPEVYKNCEGERVVRCVGLRYDKANRRFRPFAEIWDSGNHSSRYTVMVDDLAVYGGGITYRSWNAQGGYVRPVDGQDAGSTVDCPDHGAMITTYVSAHFRWVEVGTANYSTGFHEQSFWVCHT